MLGSDARIEKELPIRGCYLEEEVRARVEAGRDRETQGNSTTRAAAIDRSQWEIRCSNDAADDDDDEDDMV